MERAELTELHYITPICNVPSMQVHGLLSHNRARRLTHATAADPNVQERREPRSVPGGRALHDYANLYLCARNPMLYRLQAQHETLCVLRVSPDALDLPNAIVTDRNAAAVDYVRFYAAPGGLEHVDRGLVFAEDWTDADRVQYFRRKSAKCAEVLVPDCVPPKYIIGAYVSGDEGRAALLQTGFELPITVDGHLFFR